MRPSRRPRCGLLRMRFFLNYIIGTLILRRREAPSRRTLDRLTAVGRTEPSPDYLSWSATLSRPALTQASSLSPPGAPDTPAAPITSSPILTGSAPCAATMLVGQMHRAGRRVVLDPLHEFARRDAKSARGVGFLEAVFDRMGPGIVAAQLDDNLAVAADHGGRDAVTLALAGFGGGRRDRQGG